MPDLPFKLHLFNSKYSLISKVFTSLHQSQYSHQSLQTKLRRKSFPHIDAKAFNLINLSFLFVDMRCFVTRRRKFGDTRMDDKYSQNPSHLRVFLLNRQSAAINQCVSSVNTIFATSKSDHKQLVNSKVVHACERRSRRHMLHTSIDAVISSGFITQAFSAKRFLVEANVNQSSTKISATGDERTAKRNQKSLWQIK